MTENQNKDTLKKKGHVVPIDVSCAIPIIENNRAMRAYGLLDTGASTSCVDFKIIEILRLNPVKNLEKVMTPFGDEDVFKCPLKFTFQEPNSKSSIDINVGAFCASEKRLQIGGSQILIGRDVLQYFEFDWSGPIGQVKIKSIKDPFELR